MVNLPDAILKRSPRDNFAYVAKDRLAIATSGAMSIADSFDDQQMCERCVISTDEIDRVGDQVVSLGANYDAFGKAPSIFVNHQGEYYPIPIAFAWDLSLPLDQRKCTVQAEQHRITAVEYYSRSTPEGAIFYSPPYKQQHAP